MRYIEVFLLLILKNNFSLSHVVILLFRQIYQSLKILFLKKSASKKLTWKIKPKNERKKMKIC